MMKKLSFKKVAGVLILGLLLVLTVSSAGCVTSPVGSLEEWMHQVLDDHTIYPPDPDSETSNQETQSEVYVAEIRSSHGNLQM